MDWLRLLREELAEVGIEPSAEVGDDGSRLLLSEREAISVVHFVGLPLHPVEHAEEGVRLGREAELGRLGFLEHPTCMRVATTLGEIDFLGAPAILLLHLGMNVSHHVEPIRKLSRRPCACCGTYRAFGCRTRGRWVDLPPHRDTVCVACYRKLAFALDLERLAARVPGRCLDAEFDLAAK